MGLFCLTCFFPRTSEEPDASDSSCPAVPSTPSYNYNGGNSHCLVQPCTPSTNKSDTTTNSPWKSFMPDGYRLSQTATEASGLSVTMDNADRPFAYSPVCSPTSTISGEIGQSPTNSDMFSRFMKEHSKSTSGVCPLQQLSKEIKKLQWLGQGGCGIVFKAEWKGAPVAVKFQVSNSGEQLQASVNEALASKLLSHPNVVHTYIAQVMPVQQEWLDQPQHREYASFTAAGIRSRSAIFQHFFGTLRDNSITGLGSGSNPVVSQLQVEGSKPSTTHRLSSVTLANGQRLAVEPTGASISHKTAGASAHAAPVSVGLTPESLAALRAADRPSPPIATGGKERRSSILSIENFSIGGSFTQKRHYAFMEAIGLLNCYAGQFVTIIVMEHCDRGSLQQAINRGVFKPSTKWGSGTALRALVRTAREVAQGMCHLHANNIVHGDLKPGNVLLKSSRGDRRGFTARVSDFGFSQFGKHQSDGDEDGGGGYQGATLSHTAPEAADGQLIKPSDVYSYGMMLWQMVTGEQPFADLHWGQILEGLYSGTLTVDWPETCDPVIKRLGVACLSHAPADRPDFDTIAKVLVSYEDYVKQKRSKTSSSAAHRLIGSSAVKPPSGTPIAVQ